MSSRLPVPAGTQKLKKEVSKMTPGERIKNARVSRGLTQRQLADRLSITPACVVQWERGIRNPRFGTMKRIADALEIDIKILIPNASSITRTNSFVLELNEIFSSMNMDGQMAALRNIRELSEIPRYKAQQQKEVTKHGYQHD